MSNSRAAAPNVFDDPICFSISDRVAPISSSPVAAISALIFASDRAIPYRSIGSRSFRSAALIASTASDVVPQSKMSAERIAAIKKWMTTRVRFVSSHATEQTTAKKDKEWRKIHDAAVKEVTEEKTPADAGVN